MKNKTQKKGDIYLTPIDRTSRTEDHDDIDWDVGIWGEGGVTFRDEELAQIYYKMLELERDLKLIMMKLEIKKK